jgi:basic amino acid/polyamine antiporter, APA family
MSLFATKTIESLVAEASQPTDRGLRRVLGRRDLVGLGVGAVIGAGIFVLTGQAAAAHAGPAIVLSMAIAGLVSALAGCATRSSLRPFPSRGRPTPTRTRPSARSWPG